MGYIKKPSSWGLTRVSGPSGFLCESTQGFKFRDAIAGAEARRIWEGFSARLKPCPDTRRTQVPCYLNSMRAGNGSFSATGKVVPFLEAIVAVVGIALTFSS